MTHAAIKSGRFDKVIANDLSISPQVFKKAVEYGADDWREWVSGDEFKALDTNTVDGLAKALIFGFGYKTRSYGYSVENEKIEKSRFEQGVGSRSLNVIKSFDRIRGSVDLSILNIYKSDYSDVDIPCGSIVYADPPYKDTEAYGRKNQNKIKFDYNAFNEYLLDADFPVFVSEFSCPAGCARIASINRRQTLGNSNNDIKTEGLYIQSRFVDWYREVRPDVVLECDC